MDLLLVELESVKQENEYLKNKLKCANEIEVVLREKIEKNEVLIHTQNPILGWCILISLFLSQFIAADDLV